MKKKKQETQKYTNFEQTLKDYWKTITAASITIGATVKTVYDTFTGEYGDLVVDASAVIAGAGGTVAAITHDKGKIKEREELEAAKKRKDILEKWYAKYKPISDFDESFNTLYEQTDGIPEADRINETVNFITDLELEKTEAVHNAKKMVIEYSGKDVDISELAKKFVEDPRDPVEETIAQTLVANDIKKYVGMALNGELDERQLNSLLRRAGIHRIKRKII